MLAEKRLMSNIYLCKCSEKVPESSFHERVNYRSPRSTKDDFHLKKLPLDGQRLVSGRSGEQGLANANANVLLCWKSSFSCICVTSDVDIGDILSHYLGEAEHMGHGDAVYRL